MACEWIRIGDQSFKDDGPGTASADFAKITAYLAANYPTYEVTPSQCKGDGIQTAFPGLRFYYVDTTYRGGAMPEDRIVRNQLDLLMSIDGKGAIREWKLPSDYNSGLMKINSRVDTRIAASAILNLATKSSSREFCVKPSEVSVSSDADGWLCTATKGHIKWGVPGVEYSVSFNADGRLLYYSIKSNYPLPM